MIQEIINFKSILKARSNFIEANNKLPQKIMVNPNQDYQYIVNFLKLKYPPISIFGLKIVKRKDVKHGEWIVC